MPNKIKVRRADGTMEEYPNGKLDSIQLTPEDAVIISAGGGGGFGDPTERDVDAVKLDVIRGYVSVEKARDAYGVVLDSTGREVDHAATESLRATRRAE
jgi:N-methylhydantoinase B